MSDRPIEFSYDPASGIRTAIYRGAIDDNALLQAYRELIVRPDFVPQAHDLADLRGISGWDVTSDGLRQLGHLMSGGGKMPKPSVVAGLAIVADTPLGFGLARMYELITQAYLPKDTRVFKDADEAIAWLKELRRLD
jgi:hypothetical protein